MTITDTISILALLAALTALIWNVIRDLILDKIDIGFSIAFGELGNIKNSETAVFAPAGSLPNHKFDNPNVLLTITNVGRRSIGVASVKGKNKNGGMFFMAVRGLPKIIQPYEIFSSTNDIQKDFLERVQEDKIEKLWVVDTKGGKWPLSKKAWIQLKETADYITSKKHI
ncbi:MAG: hypothetical protein AAB518_02670 [Patescibacteria group bacterium]